MTPRWIPKPELEFSSKTGFLSKALWDEFFAGASSRAWRSERWKLLVERGIYLKHPGGLGNFIVPNPRNIVVRNICPGGVVKAPFVSQLKHDEILAKGLLQCLKSRAVTSFVNEAMLRKVEATGFALKELQKLPDLIVDLKSGNRFAIELELTQKSATRYADLFSAYRTRRDLKGIVFVVEGRSCLEAIVKASSKAIFENVPIGFIDLKDWQTNAPRAKVSFESSMVELGAL